MTADISTWDQFIATHPDSHILQTGNWGALKSTFGWTAERIVCGDSGAQVLFRRLPLGYSIAYIPKGPNLLTNELLNELDRVCQLHKAIFLKIEPFAWEPYLTWQRLEDLGWHRSESIQPRRTVTISLTLSSEEILAGMKQKTRYNIRLAEKKGIEVRQSEDYALFAEMALVTGKRDGFGVHSAAYYQKIKEQFIEEGKAVLLMAYFENQPVAGIIVFAHGKTAWYMYGASTDTERNRMPTYLLQWEAIKWAQAKSCEEYDLWGIPDHDEEELEALFESKQHHDGLWGVYRFKRGFGGKIKRSVGAWDKAYQPLLYKAYRIYNLLKNKGLD
jgi:lipid II:glycine glycyltransferase (peptidoglycan interpeptide bridge formation enzyme)